MDVEGHAVKMKPTKKFTLDMQNKYSHSPVHWRKFSSDVRDLYAKSRQETKSVGTVPPPIFIGVRLMLQPEDHDTKRLR